MTLKIYIGTADEITSRLAGAPEATETTIASVTSTTVFSLTSATSFSAGDSVVIGKEKAVIDSLDGTTVTLKQALGSLPTVGARVRHYDADYTKYRDQGVPFVFIDDRKTGGQTGTYLGQDLTLFDYDVDMPDIVSQNRITIFESTASDTPLFAGVIVAATKTQLSKNDSAPVYQWQIEAQGYQWEADGIGINEQPFTNINAGSFLEFLRSKWTNLSIGEIDTTDSPRLDYIRLANFRRFSDVGNALADVWPGGEFYIGNNHTGGAVYYRKQVQSFAPIMLNQAYLEKIGNRQDQYVNIRTDYDKVYNMVLLPYYRDQLREPDFHVQSTVADEAFLKTSVVLAGQPTSVEESQLLFDDFSSSDLNSDFLEFDKDNPSPPDGFNAEDGYLVQGQINGVPGLHLLDTDGASPAIELGDIGRVTDPAEVEPFTGTERQMLYIQEMVISELGDALVMGIVDQTSRVMTVVDTGVAPTTTECYVSFDNDEIDYFHIGDRLTIGGVETVLTAESYDGVTGERNPVIEYEALDNAPSVGDTVLLSQNNLSRVAFAVYFKENGDLKYIKDGEETAFDTPRTYTAGPSTYSLRLYMQAFETTIASGASSTGCTLDDATNFTTGDVVEIFTTGSRTSSERRVITVSGSDITYAETTNTPLAGYRVRTLPKMVLQIKGGSEYGDITGRDWTTIYTAANTWQDSADTDKDDYGVLLVMNKSLVGTIPFFSMKDPIPVTAEISGQYLHIGTQEVETSNPDVDCILRKVGSHYQLDFFPDTKALWASGSTLELRYKERWRQNLESKDLESMRALAKVRGFELPENATEQELVRRGGKALDGIDILPNPISDFEAIAQSEELLAAISSPAVTVDILTNTYLDEICKAGQTIASELPGVPDVVIQRVQISEIPGLQNESGSSMYRQQITAGTVDRLSDILKRRAISGERRIVIDEGASDDTFTSFQKSNITEKATVSGTFTTDECASPSTVLWNGSTASKVKCLAIGKGTGYKTPSVITDVYSEGAWSDLENITSDSEYATLAYDYRLHDTVPIALSDFDLNLPVSAEPLQFRLEMYVEASGLRDDWPFYLDEIWITAGGWTDSFDVGSWSGSFAESYTRPIGNGINFYTFSAPFLQLLPDYYDEGITVADLNDPSFKLELFFYTASRFATLNINRLRIALSYK